MATFGTVQTRERAIIGRQRANREFADAGRDAGDPYGFRNSSEYWGLALSGGGIRSASFALGVMQALATTGAFRRIDYLSTVSGGGYIGTALTWLNHLRTQGKLPDLTHTLFPLGRRYVGSRASPDRSEPLDFIRHHGDYLRPAALLNSIALAAVVLRNVWLSLAVFFGLTVGAIELLRLYVPPAVASLEFEVIAYVIAGAFGGGVGVYALISWAMPAIAAVWRARAQWLQVRHYQLAIIFQRGLGVLLSILGAAALIKMVPPAARWLESLGDTHTAASQPELQLVVGVVAAVALVVIFTVVIVVSRLRADQRGIADAPQRGGLAVKLIATVIGFGWFVFAFALTDRLGAICSLIVLALAIAAGFFVHSNYFGLSRMYRDRLMEAFLPDPRAIERNAWKPAITANSTMLTSANGDADFGPYHLINATLVVTAHPEAKFTQRGGDNYLFSHAFCGCDAVAAPAAGVGGWIETKAFAGKPISWATAMAASGAAVNPGAAGGGDGVTRSRIVSFVMAIMNVRLGYWLPNYHRNFRGLKEFWVRRAFPNLLAPGLRQGLFGDGQGPESGYLQLTDGGHFDNTALYELFRREIDVIILSDAGADGDYRFEDLANATERARADFGVGISFRDGYGLDQLTPGTDGNDAFGTRLDMARRGFAVASLRYASGNTGVLIVLKPTLVRGLPYDIYRYRALNPTFPAQSTTDQFFGERQLEAYRELGYQLTRRMIDEGVVTEWFNT